MSCKPMQSSIGQHTIIHNSFNTQFKIFYDFVALQFQSGSLKCTDRVLAILHVLLRLICYKLCIRTSSKVYTKCMCKQTRLSVYKWRFRWPPSCQCDQTQNYKGGCETIYYVIARRSSMLVQSAPLLSIPFPGRIHRL